MSQKRIDLILNIIKEQGYVTVKYLCDELHYSTATINRDLNDLQNKKLIVRHYGGAELASKKGTPLVFRYHKMRPVKRVIAKKAAELIKDGMTVFIDGTTTTQYIGQYIKPYKNLTVITNNLNLVSHLSEQGISCICLGGKVFEPPYMLGGPDTAAHARSYTADIAFFSTNSFSTDGKILGGDGYHDLHKAMIANSTKSVFLADHEKINNPANRILCELSDINVIITDYVFSDEVKAKYANTEFIEVKTPKTQKN